MVLLEVCDWPSGGLVCCVHSRSVSWDTIDGLPVSGSFLVFRLWFVPGSMAAVAT